MLKTGKSFTCRAVVGVNSLADVVGSGDMAVFATPSMVALMEQAACMCVADMLDDGDTTVGTFVAINHSRATALDECVCATATLVDIQGRELSFDVSAEDGQGVIGCGTHKRFIVNRVKFLAKLQGNVVKNS